MLGSRPGANGGFRLIKRPQDVTLGQVIRTLDGPLAPIPCVSQTAYQKCQNCPYTDELECPIKSVMSDVRMAIVNVLDRYTLLSFSQQVKNGAMNLNAGSSIERALGTELG